MPTASTVLRHPNRAQIEMDLASGKPIRQISAKYGISIHVLYRYKAQIPAQLKAKHMGARLRAGVDLDRLRIDESEGILQNLAMQRARLLLVQDSALESGDRREVAYIADVIHRNVKLTGVYLGEFARHQVKTSINILISAEYLELRAKLLQVLSGFPEARRAVAGALQDAEARAAEPPKVIEGTVVEHEANA